jgi:hypothetical protein
MLVDLFEALAELGKPPPPPTVIMDVGQLGEPGGPVPAVPQAG